ncbi:hypothetical protein MSKU15_2251 [Komagataeibacter diospyri]|uniref:hypothetical protein n=1 Tax=Komagataeibacter diospyri TaxID=1932662 RepID=UPI0011394439|nr:hypothetical protein [Komagataeibacter diospyri]GCE90650.1 hypothetical protein MSKU15_2251 [Komagataeibacter diospyri]
MGIINNLNSFFGNYKDTFYIEKISIDEIYITKDGKIIPDKLDILQNFLYEQEEMTVLNTREGFVFHIGGDSYVIDFDDYLTKNINLYPKATISRKGTGLEIKLFMRHD